MNLRGKRVLITGGAKRIGAAIAREFARRGANLFLHYRESKREAEGLAREIQRSGSRCEIFRADLSRLTEIRRMTRKILHDFGGVDILVNNAAIFYRTPFGKISGKDWDNFLSVNLKAPLFLAQELAPAMIKRGGGRILNIADWTGLKPRRDYLPYDVSKAGLLGLTQALAKSLAPKVLVTAVCPGPILPPRGATGSRKKEIVEKTLVGRWGGLEEVVKTVLFLAESDFMTGSYHLVDGGELLRG